MKKLVFILCIKSLLSIEATQEFLQKNLNQAFSLLKENKFNESEIIYKIIYEKYKYCITESSEAAFAIGFIEKYYKNNSLDCHEYFFYACKAGILPAFYELKYLKTISNDIFPKIDDYSISLFEKIEKYYSSTKNLPVFFHILGLIQNNLYKNTKKAREYYIKSSDQGNCKSSYNIGCIYYGENDMEMAKKYWNIGSDQGDFKSSCNIGIFYKKEGNIEKAKEYFEKAITQVEIEKAKKCYTDASFNKIDTFYLGYSYDEMGDIEKAKEYYKKSSNQGNSMSSHNLGLLYKKEKNMINSIECFEKAIIQGNTRSFYELGLLYEEQRNIEKAKECYTKGSDQGNSWSSCNLGLLYESEKNIKKAKEYYTKGFYQRDSISFSYLVDLYKEEKKQKK